MKLTVTAIKNAQPKVKPYKIYDSAGLYLLIIKNGSKFWRFNYKFSGKHKTLALGVFPAVSLKQARLDHGKAKQMLSDGLDPTHERKVQKALKKMQQNSTFRSVSLEWLEKQKPIWAKTHYDNVKGRLYNYVFSVIGDKAIAHITAPDLLALLQPIENLGYNETAHRVRALCGQIFRYAVITGRAGYNPAADLQGALVPVRAISFAALTDPVEVGGLLRAIDEYSGDMMTRCALKFAPLVFVRPKELRMAEWSEINLSRKQWLIPASKMKMRNDHIVPLSDQAIEVLKEVHPATGKGRYIFASVRNRDRPMSDNTINAALRRMGFTKQEMTGHGFRAMASTLLNEQGLNHDWIEIQLAHTESNKIRAAYNRAKYLPQRKIMMQQWADYLDNLRKGADVIQLLDFG
jgi:integrase